MNICITPLAEYNKPLFIKQMQEAFQLGFEDIYGHSDVQILPEKDIHESFASNGAIAYQALVDGKLAGGAIISIDADVLHGDLQFLYVQHEFQGCGVGYTLWKNIETMHPEILVWQTVTPYFEKRNIHFYINKCGFAAVEFFHMGHTDPNVPDDMPGGDEFFGFMKKMR